MTTFVARRRGRRTAHPEMDTLTVAQRADNRVIELIGKLGGDVEKEREVEFFLYLPTEEAAYRVASALQRDGFHVNVHQGEKHQDWLCFATKKIVPTSDNMRTLRKYFMELVKPLKGKYDGWGTGVEDGTLG